MTKAARAIAVVPVVLYILGAQLLSGCGVFTESKAPSSHFYKNGNKPFKVEVYQNGTKIDTVENVISARFSSTQSAYVVLTLEDGTQYGVDTHSAYVKEVTTK